jgi:pyrimidine operon attenuation protein / uracil phosphoribosyltransferase
MSKDKTQILSKTVAGKKLLRMAYEILENNLEEESIVLAGIKENGIVIAKSRQKNLEKISEKKIILITVTLNKKMPADVILDTKLDFNGKVVILIDDVANSGRTMLYALKPFLDFHPKKIQTLILVERSHKKFPVNPDYVGLSISTTLAEHIYVEVEADEISGAWLE